ncbi:uncharacterized protein BDZ83DRAFT_646035 [Colletotrichum acutatum]|uniref:Uncharacterized protein n=1 Tax=Glomerella acutata TaxID=27357 RepID=A0AAD9D3I3_GLOAC|nr:uncharacterized protein BDZ83DRAFT_646035 [Colletotrichum acutatum]KAK1731531.1 hypothetical protein BDZ83DRAFT_646035 [Colletotrichum acutatum]
MAPPCDSAPIIGQFQILVVLYFCSSLIHSKSEDIQRAHRVASTCSQPANYLQPVEDSLYDMAFPTQRSSSISLPGSFDDEAVFWPALIGKVSTGEHALGELLCEVCITTTPPDEILA